MFLDDYPEVVPFAILGLGLLAAAVVAVLLVLRAGRAATLEVKSREGRR